MIKKSQVTQDEQDLFDALDDTFSLVVVERPPDSKWWRRTIDTRYPSEREILVLKDSNTKAISRWNYFENFMASFAIGAFIAGTILTTVLLMAEGTNIVGAIFLGLMVSGLICFGIALMVAICFGGLLDKKMPKEKDLATLDLEKFQNTHHVLKKLNKAADKAEARKAMSTKAQFDIIINVWSNVLYGLVKLDEADERDNKLEQLWSKAKDIDGSTKIIADIRDRVEKRKVARRELDERAALIVKQLDRLDNSIALLDAYTDTEFQDNTDRAVIKAIEDLSLSVIDNINSLVSGVSTIQEC